MGEPGTSTPRRAAAFWPLMQASGSPQGREAALSLLTAPVAACEDGLFVTDATLARQVLGGDSCDAGMAVAARLWADRATRAPLARAVAHGFPPFAEARYHDVLRPVVVEAIAALDGTGVAAVVDKVVGDAVQGGDVAVELVDDLLAPVFARWLDVLLGGALARRPDIGEVADRVPALIDGTVRRRELAGAHNVAAAVLDDTCGFLAAVARSPNRAVAALPGAFGEALGLPAGSDAVALRTLGALGFLRAAGVDTTTAMVAQVLALLSDHRRWQQLCAGQLSAEWLVAEALRLSSPVRVLARSTTRPLTLGPVEVPRGAVVFAALGVANWRHPGLGSRRGRPRHLAFGHGPHACPGSVHARSLGTAFVRSILAHCSRPPGIVSVRHRTRRCNVEHLAGVTVVLRP